VSARAPGDMLAVRGRLVRAICQPWRRTERRIWSVVESPWAAQLPSDEAMQYIKLDFVPARLERALLSAAQKLPAGLPSTNDKCPFRHTATHAQSPLDTDDGGVIVLRLNVAG
jgi:hypothetical protein